MCLPQITQDELCKQDAKVVQFENEIKGLTQRLHMLLQQRSELSALKGLLQLWQKYEIEEQQQQLDDDDDDDDYDDSNESESDYENEQIVERANALLYNTNNNSNNTNSYHNNKLLQYQENKLLTTKAATIIQPTNENTKPNINHSQPSTTTSTATITSITNDTYCQTDLDYKNSLVKAKPLVALVDSKLLITPRENEEKETLNTEYNNVHMNCSNNNNDAKDTTKIGGMVSPTNLSPTAEAKEYARSLSSGGGSGASKKYDNNNSKSESKQSLINNAACTYDVKHHDVVMDSIYQPQQVKLSLMNENSTSNNNNNNNDYNNPSISLLANKETTIATKVITTEASVSLKSPPSSPTSTETLQSFGLSKEMIKKMTSRPSQR